jgi:hypothetical protein
VEPLALASHAFALYVGAVLSLINGFRPSVEVAAAELRSALEVHFLALRADGHRGAAKSGSVAPSWSGASAVGAARGQSGASAVGAARGQFGASAVGAARGQSGASAVGAARGQSGASAVGAARGQSGATKLDQEDEGESVSHKGKKGDSNARRRRRCEPITRHGS